MDIRVMKDVSNKLFNRKELFILASYTGKTPSRAEIKEEVCRTLNLNPELTLVVKVVPLYGVMQSEVQVHSYSSKEAMGVEQKYLFDRLNKKKEPKPKAQAQQPAQPAQAEKEAKPKQEEPEKSEQEK
jgi:ribosomal protein S24E